MINFTNQKQKPTKNMTLDAEFLFDNQLFSEMELLNKEFKTNYII